MKSSAFTCHLLQKLAQACTLEELLNEASLLGLSDLTACDAAYNLLASSGPLRNDNVFVLQQSQKWIMRPEIIDEMQTKGVPQKLRSSPEPFWFYNTAIHQWETFCPILYGGQVLGYLFQRTEQAPPTEAAACWTALAQAAAVVIQRSGGVEPDAGQLLQESVLLQLALGQLTDPSIAHARLKQSGWTTPPSYRLGCLFTNEISLFAILRPEQLSAQLRNAFPGCICCCYRDRMIILGPGSLEQQSNTRIRLRHWLNYHHFHIAVSTPYSQLIDTPTAYAQAEELVHVGRTFVTPELIPEILYYEDHLPLCSYLSAYKKDDLSRHIHPHISCFMQHDREHRTQYLHTLSVYFSCGRNMTQTSHDLFIHKTTLFYRFERMEKLVGPFLQNPHLLFLYEYSLNLLQAFPASSEELSISDL